MRSDPIAKDLSHANFTGMSAKNSTSAAFNPSTNLPASTISHHHFTYAKHTLFTITYSLRSLRFAHMGHVAEYLISELPDDFRIICDDNSLTYQLLEIKRKINAGKQDD